MLDKLWAAPAHGATHNRLQRGIVIDDPSKLPKREPVTELNPSFPSRDASGDSSSVSKCPSTPSLEELLAHFGERSKTEGGFLDTLC